MEGCCIPRTLDVLGTSPMDFPWVIVTRRVAVASSGGAPRPTPWRFHPADLKYKSIAISLLTSSPPSSLPACQRAQSFPRAHLRQHSSACRSTPSASPLWVRHLPTPSLSVLQLDHAALWQLGHFKDENASQLQYYKLRNRTCDLEKDVVRRLLSPGPNSLSLNCRLARNQLTS